VKFGDHEARAEELNTDLIRWVRDRDARLAAEIFRALGLARQGVIENAVQLPVPKELEGTEPGSQADSGAFVTHVERLMRQALHEYRDEASRKVRIYRAMARSEGRLHGFLRKRRHGRVPSALRLPDDGRAALASWRKRQVPTTKKPAATVKDDPTRDESAADIRPLEDGTAGLTWDAGSATQSGRRARQSRASGPRS
jgi:hypothetical protein